MRFNALISLLENNDFMDGLDVYEKLNKVLYTKKTYEIHKEGGWVPYRTHYHDTARVVNDLKRYLEDQDAQTLLNGGVITYGNILLTIDPDTKRKYPNKWDKYDEKFLTQPVYKLIFSVLTNMNKTVAIFALERNENPESLKDTYPEENVRTPTPHPLYSANLDILQSIQQKAINAVNSVNIADAPPLKQLATLKKLQKPLAFGVLQTLPEAPEFVMYKTTLLGIPSIKMSLNDAINAKALTPTTINNLKTAAKYGVKWQDCYFTLLVPDAHGWSKYVTGTLNGKKVVFGRIETAGAQSGQTRIYFEDKPTDLFHQWIAMAKHGLL